MDKITQLAFMTKFISRDGSVRSTKIDSAEPEQQPERQCMAGIFKAVMLTHQVISLHY